MARMLGRSKSLRLKSSQKDLRQQEVDALTPLPAARDEDPRGDLHGLKAAAHATDAAKRADEPEQVQRPRAASAAGDRGRHLQFHKKAAPGTATSDEASFDFPLPSPTTVLYAAEVHEDDMIGMALGSPTTPARWNHHHPVQPTDYVTRPGMNRTLTHIGYDPSFDSSMYEDGVAKSSMTDSEAGRDVTKPKISRWKSIFGRKNSTPQPFYQLQQSSAPPSRVDSHNDVVSQRQRSSSLASTRAASTPTAPTSAHEIREARKKHKAAKKAAADEAKHKPDSGKSFTSRHDQINAEASPKPPPKDDWHYKLPKVTVSNGSQTTSPRTPGPGPLLDVDIPNVEMERYSVMFGSLLRPDRSSSLLVRRQADPGKLKPLTELSKKNHHTDSSNTLLKPTRRATSPSPAKSPTFALSLFPPPASKRDHHPPSPRGVPAMHRPRPLARSNTAPSISPSRQTFADVPQKVHTAAAAPRMHQLAEADPEPVAQPQLLLTPTPSTRHSFDSEETAFVPLVVNPGVWKPRIDEPEWEIVSKPEGVSQVQRDGQGQGVAGMQQPRPSPHSLQQQKQKSPEERAATAFSPTSIKSRDSPRAQVHHSSRDRDSPRDRQSPQSHAQGPTVGLARQVSVSRATGPKLLKPMVGSPVSERMVERKPLTPTLVELRHSGRKSQRVVLEDA